MTFAIAWHWPLVIALALYLVSALAVVASRIGYERRRRLLDRIEAAVRDQSRTAGASELDETRIFAGVSPDQARRLPFEHRVPPTVNAALARFLVSTVGLERLRAVASSHRRSQWKRIAALRLLALARPQDALPLLDAATRDHDEDVVAAAVATLGSLSDPTAAAILIGALEANRFQPSRVATFLDRFPLDIPEMLRPLTSGTTPTTRYWGAVLARRYRGVAWLEDALVRLADDPAPIVRKAALQSLGALGVADGASVAAAALTDPIWYVRAHAARALGELGAAGCARDVAKLLADPAWWVRQAAKDALARMGEAAEESVIACLSHPDRFARNSAAEVLQNTGAFERMLVSEEVVSQWSRGSETLRLIRRAGGNRLARAVVERLPPDLRSRGAAALSALDEPEVSL